MTQRVQHGGLQVASDLDDLLKNEIVEGIDIDSTEFWTNFELILEEFVPWNEALLKKREDFQSQIDQWHLKNNKTPFDLPAYKRFLEDIGYLLKEREDFQITTDGVDPEISKIAGAQLVVPVMNARFSLNAANARWGSLYDALYGTDVISEKEGAEKGGAYNSIRGNKVIEFSKDILDQIIPLSEGSFSDITGFEVEEGTVGFTMSDQTKGRLKTSDQFIGFKGKKDNPSSILLKNNNLHIEIQIDRNDSVGKDDPAGIKDILLESAITTILDCEDSVAAVDAKD